MKIEVFPETPQDIISITAVNNAAFGRTEESVLITKLRATAKFSPALSLVAKNGAETVGHILFYPVDIKTACCPRETLALAPMAVLPQFQKKGIGSQLVKAGLETAAMLGYQSCIVLGHAQYYPRFGFRKASEYSIKAPFAVPDEAFMAMELQHGTLTGCAGTVIYPPEYLETT